MSVPLLSDYALKLEPHVKDRYLQKIAAIGIDPVTQVNQSLSLHYSLSDLFVLQHGDVATVVKNWSRECKRSIDLAGTLEPHGLNRRDEL